MSHSTHPVAIPTPNLVSPLLTLSTLEYPRIVLAEANLSYLGLGIQPPGASWELMVSEGSSTSRSVGGLSRFPVLPLLSSFLRSTSWLVGFEL